MATTLQQLLDDLAAQVAAPAIPIEDVGGALGHLGRALGRLAEDGLTADGGPRERTAARLGAACTTAGELWPATGGALTDLAGAAADVIGRDRAILGRSHRWAVTVELAERADHCARLGRRLLPQAAVAELTAVRRLAAAVERDAQAEPPTAAGSALLDRLVPVPGAPGDTSEVTALDASAALIAALDRAHQSNELTLRDFRAAVAAAEVGSRSAAAVTAAVTDGEAGPLLVTAAAWQLAGRISMAFEDGRRTRPTDPRGVVPWAQALANTLHTDVGSSADLAALRDRPDFAGVANRVQRVTNELPVLADQLTAAVSHWALNGQLYAHARDLPHMADMPEHRVREVLAGHRVQALGADLDRLGHAVDLAAALSTALADALNRAATPTAPAQRHLADLYRQQVHAPGAGERLLAQAQAVQHALDATRAPQAPTIRRTPGPSQDR